MTKVGPPVGCAVFVDNRNGVTGIEKLLRAFEPLVAFGDRQYHEGAVFSDRHYHEGIASPACASLGGEQLELIVITEKIEVANMLLLDFNEEEFVDLARAQRIDMAELFIPYVEVAKAVDETLTIALGFDLMAPSDLREQSLYDVGVALLFVRDENSPAWLRKQLRPFVGHYLP